MSLTTRLLIFTGITTILGISTFSYMLISDENFLIESREKIPSIVNFFAPIIGLEVIKNEETGQEEVYIPSIEEVVGDKIDVAAKLENGQIILIEALPNDTNEMLLNKVRKVTNNDNDIVIEYKFLDDDELAVLKTKTQDELTEDYALIKVPNLPNKPYTKQNLNFTLDLCRLAERDVVVQLELQHKYGSSKTSLENTLTKLENRKLEIKELLRKV